MVYVSTNPPICSTVSIIHKFTVLILGTLSVRVVTFEKLMAKISDSIIILNSSLQMNGLHFDTFYAYLIVEISLKNYYFHDALINHTLELEWRTRIEYEVCG